MPSIAVFENESIAIPMQGVFNRAAQERTAVRLTFIGDKEPMTFAGTISVSFYQNGLAFTSPERTAVIPYSAIRSIEAVSPEHG